MATEQDLLELESQCCSFGDTVHYLKTQKLFDRCDGSWVYDAAGKEYLDMQMWYSAVNFGYRNKEINSKLHEQIDRLPQLASQFLHKEKILLAAGLAHGTEQRLGMKGRIHFNVGGSQAVEDSLKIVRNYTGGKGLMFAFMGGYHGRTLGASEITSSYRYRRRYGSFANRAIFIPYPYCFRCFYGKKCPSCQYECIRQFAKLFETEYYGVFDAAAGKAEYAAFYAEAVQGTGGYVIPPPEYFSRLAEILRKYGILLVDDEIQMGFYRTGKLWAMEHYGVKPDVIVFGKSLTNGLNPLSGLWAREELINPQIFPPGSTHSTFSSNPLGTATGLAVLDYLEQQDWARICQEKGQFLLKELRKLQKKYPVIGDVDGLGMALRVEMTKPDGFTPDRALTDAIAEEGVKGDIDIGVAGKKFGLILDVGGYYKNTFTLAPALTISYEEMELFIKLFSALVKRCSGL